VTREELGEEPPWVEDDEREPCLQRDAGDRARQGKRQERNMARFLLRTAVLLTCLSMCGCSLPQRFRAGRLAIQYRRQHGLDWGRPVRVERKANGSYEFEYVTSDMSEEELAKLGPHCLRADPEIRRPAMSRGSSASDLFGGKLEHCYQR